jgi:hypothetical protein
MNRPGCYTGIGRIRKMVELRVQVHIGWGQHAHSGCRMQMARCNYWFLSLGTKQSSVTLCKCAEVSVELICYLYKKNQTAIQQLFNTERDMWEMRQQARDGWVEGSESGRYSCMLLQRWDFASALVQLLGSPRVFRLLFQQQYDGVRP